MQMNVVRIALFMVTMAAAGASAAQETKPKPVARAEAGERANPEAEPPEA